MPVFNIDCDLTVEDIKELIEHIRKTFFKAMSDDQFCDVIETNHYPLPFYAIGHLSTVCKKAGLNAKISVTS